MKLNSEIVELAIEYTCSHISTHIDEKCIYHDLSHTVFVVEKVAGLANKLKLDKQQTRIVTVAAWFHDTGYSSEANGHETRGAALAKDFLTEYNIDKEEIETVFSCILSTAIPQKPTTMLQKILCDADMMYLVSKNFMDSSNRLRKEWEITQQRFYTDTEWLQLNIDFIRGHRFHTVYAIKNFESKKQKTIGLLKKKLHLTNEEEKKLINDTKNNAKLERKVFMYGRIASIVVFGISILLTAL